MIEQEEEFEYDVFYRGTKQQLYAFLYPLTGPNSPLFDHLSLKRLTFTPTQHSFEAQYEPNDFENIDRQKENLTYKSTHIPTQSNYFYSVYQPDYKYFLWQNVRNFVEMRPKNTDNPTIKEKPGSVEEEKVSLETVSFEENSNKGKEIIENSVMMAVKDNWEVSKDEYLLHLAK